MKKQSDDSFLYGNISIDLNKKNNEKKSSSRPRRTSRKSLSIASHHKKVSSDHFLGQAQTPINYDPILDPKKLIKKGEKPVRLGSLLGSEQVGQCLFIEYENDMIIIDAGMEFAAEEELGADYIVPDIAYVKKNIKKLRGIVITHGHLDHIGALRDILPDLGYPMIYTTPLAL
ncbi:MAG: MBL fold metallo-hydrolase [bacterium]|nr:MBL fold metallo-hydrolase [bacterium]